MKNTAGWQWGRPLGFQKPIHFRLHLHLNQLSGPQLAPLPCQPDRGVDHISRNLGLFGVWLAHKPQRFRRTGGNTQATAHATIAIQKCLVAFETQGSSAMRLRCTASSASSGVKSRRRIRSSTPVSVGGKPPGRLSKC